MASRYQTLNFTTGTVNAGATLQANQAVGPSLFNIVKIKIVPDSGSETFDFRVYKSNTFASGKRLIRYDDQVPNLYDPVDRSAGLPGVEMNEGPPFPYDDDDSGGQLHYEFVNNGVSAHTYTVTIEYEEVPLMSSGGVPTFRGGFGASQFTAVSIGGAVGAANTLKMYGSSSGAITIQPAAAAGTWSFTLPTTAGTNLYPLVTNGSGVSSWSQLAVGGGGTGAGTFTANGVIYGNGTSAFQVTAQGAANSILTANAGAPAFTQTPTINTSLTIGVTGSQAGTLLLKGSSTGTVTVAVAAAAGTWTLTLPTTAGTNLYFLQTDGSGVTTWAAGTGGISGSLTSGRVTVGAGASSVQDYAALTFDGTILTTNTLVVSSTNPSCLSGGTTVVDTLCRFAGTFSPSNSSNNDHVIDVNLTMNLVANDSGYGMRLRPTFKKAASGTHGSVSILSLDAVISATNSSTAVSNAYQLKVPTVDWLAGTTTAYGIYVGSPANATTSIAQAWLTSAGSEDVDLYVTATHADLNFNNTNYGNNVAASHLFIGRNSNGSTEGPAAGSFQMRSANNTQNHIWADNSSVLRINTAAPTGSSGSPTVSDTAGTIIGTQTSYFKLKSGIQAATDDDHGAALSAILKTPLFNYTMNEDGKARLGFVIYEEDRGSWYSYNDREDQTPALDIRNIFGHFAGAIKTLDGIQRAHEDRLRALEA